MNEKAYNVAVLFYYVRRFRVGAAISGTSPPQLQVLTVCHLDDNTATANGTNVITF
jgi:hypothetical protein